MTNVKSKLNESDESNKDKDKLDKTTGVFVILLININDVDKTNEIYFTLVISLLS
jgi:hypothetical protein